MVLLLAAGWVMSGILVADVPPLAVAFGRTLASFVAITVICVFRPRGWAQVGMASRRVKAVVLLAFLGFFVYYLGTLLGVGHIGASRVGVVVSLLPCITFAIGIAAFHEIAARRKVFGTVLAVIAALVYALGDSGAGSATVTSGALLSGVLLTLGGTFAYALYGYVYRHFMSDVPPVAALPAVTGFGAVMLGVAASLFVPLGSVGVGNWAGIAVLGALLTAPVFLISHELILRKGPLYTSAVALVVPFLVRLGEWALGEAQPPGALSVACLLVCSVGVWMTVSAGAAKGLVGSATAESDRV